MTASTSAFGLNLSIADAIALPELGARREVTGSPALMIALGAVDGNASTPVFRLDDGDGDALVVCRDDDGVYTMKLRDYGAFSIDAAAEQLLCDPYPGDLRWQDALIAQALPFAAVMLGVEVFHASAVVTADDTATLFFAPSGTGKSTLAAHLVACGARLLADDAVAAVLPAGGGVAAHAGSTWVQLAPGDADVIAATCGGARRVGTREGKHTIQLPCGEAATYPVSRVVLVRRDTSATPVSAVQLPAIAPTALLGSSLSQTVNTRSRLIHQLDVCAEIARTAAMWELSFGTGTSPGALAAFVTEAILST